MNQLGTLEIKKVGSGRDLTTTQSEGDTGCVSESSPAIEGGPVRLTLHI